MDGVRRSDVHPLLPEVIVLVSGGTKTVRRMAHHPNLGVLLVPSAGNRETFGLPWAIDNGAFSGFDEGAYLSLLEVWSPRANECLFATCPDVVGDAEETLALFDVWRDRVFSYGFPVALVLQDGMTVEGLSDYWDRLHAVFVGGSTDYKLGRDAALIVAAAKRRGLWCHMGRVNTGKRVKHAARIGVDSVDGSQFSRFSETHLPWFLQALSDLDKQLELV